MTKAKETDRKLTFARPVAPPPPDIPRWLVIAVALCFFLSGAAGLGYQVRWVRFFDKVIGSAPFAVATGITVVMTGLALGSWLAGKRLDRLSSRSALLALYGKLELAIGAFALFVPLAIEAGRPIYRAIYDRLLDHFWCYQMVAFLGCTLLLILPTACMGATLPVLCRFSIHSTGRIATTSGRLYGLNTLGAGLGSILCGFFLIRTYGVTATLWLFVMVNVLVGGVCLVLSRYLPHGTMTIPEEAKPSLPKIEARPHQVRWALPVFAVTGFCSMAYEVLWIRLLALLAGPTTYSFTLVVATFIVGLALGSILFCRVADRSRSPFILLLLTQVGAAISALAVSQLLGSGQFFFAKLIQGCRDDFVHLMLLQSATLFAVLLPPTLFLGAAFPLVNRLYVRSIKGMAKSLGTAYAINTVGAIAGSFIAGFLLIPLMGMEHGLRLVIFLQLAVAGLAFVGTADPARGWGLVRKATVFAALAAILSLPLHYPAWHTDHLSRGWYRDFRAIAGDLRRTGWFDALWQGDERIAAQRQGLEVVFHGEGVAGFTTVEKEITSLGTVEYAMFNSGKADASSHGDRSTQALSAHIPMLFHPGAKDVMVLGLASGMTAGETLLYPLEHLDIVEINAQVVAAARQFFHPWYNNCLDDPRSRVLIQDGRNHLALTASTYDIIISEPSNPWMAGLANLYSREFFELARGRLKNGGLFAQWIQAYEMDWQTFALLGRTFTAVFPQGALVKVGPVDYLLLGFTGEGQGFDWTTAASNFPYAQTSKNITLPGMEFLAHLILTEDLPGLFGQGPLHTDKHPHLEFMAPRKLYSGNLDIDALVAEHRHLSASTERFKTEHSNYNTLLDLVEFSASANVPVFNLLPWQRLDHEQQVRYQSTVDDYCRRVLIPSYSIISEPILKTRCAEVQMRAIAAKIAENDSHPIDHYNLALAQTATGDKSEAIISLRTTLNLDADHEPALIALGLLLAETGKFAEAEEVLDKAAVLSPEKATTRKYLGMVRLRQGKTDAAIADLNTAQSLDPSDPTVTAELGAAHLQRGDTGTAVFHLEKAMQNNSGDRVSQQLLERAREMLRGSGR